MSATITRPELTLPEAEAEALRGLYSNARVILEYGSGGSTVMASEMPGKSVFSVESDKDWALMMRAWFAQTPPVAGTQVDVVWSDVGPTKAWGYPADDSGWMRYAQYPLKVWDLPEFEQPDVVLIDGRFRTGCALATAFRTTKPVTVLVDDYKRRRQYHKIETYLGAPQLIGRLARFDKVGPIPVPAKNLLKIIEMMTRP